MESEAYDLDKQIVPCRKSSDKPPESYLQVLNNAVFLNHDLCCNKLFWDKNTPVSQSRKLQRV